MKKCLLALKSIDYATKPFVAEGLHKYTSERWRSLIRNDTGVVPYKPCGRY